MRKGQREMLEMVKKKKKIDKLEMRAAEKIQQKKNK